MQPRESKGQDQLGHGFWSIKEVKKKCTGIKKGLKIFIQAKIGKILIWIHCTVLVFLS